MLTAKRLGELAPGIFAKGISKIDSPYEPNAKIKVKWVAVRGQIDDWAIYCDEILNRDWEVVRDWGNKIVSEKTIKELVKCDNEAFNKYRY